MTDESLNPSMNNKLKEGSANPEQQTTPDEPKVMDVMDLVYKGGFDRDPQEILGNPAVAPEMIQEGRDLRVDLFRDPEEADPKQES